jgi:hypothetical protein
MSKKDTTLREPSKTTAFEMLIREEPDLSVTYRLLWLLTALSHSRHYTFISEVEMARQLKTTEWQIQNSLRIIRAIRPRLFARKTTVGVHRPNQYHRRYLPGETVDEFILRAQTCPGIDICLGLHWVACVVAGEAGIAEFSARGLWPVDAETLRRARRKMHNLGYFKVDTTEQGKPAKYIANYDWKPVKPTPAEIDQNSHKVDIEQQYRKELAVELGEAQRITATKIETSLPKKRIVTIKIDKKARTNQLEEP